MMKYFAGIVFLTCTLCLNLNAQEWNSGVVLELTGHYSQAHGPLAAAQADGNSGFAGGGGGFCYGAGLMFNNEYGGLGFAVDIRASWLQTQQSALEEFLDQAYEGQSTEYLPRHRSWEFFTWVMGPTANIHTGPLIIEGRFLIGGTNPRNAAYETYRGNYIPEDWGKFFLTEDNETPQSERRKNFTYSPELVMRYAFSEHLGITLKGNFTMTTLKQEMEIIREVPIPGGVQFQRTQYNYQQSVRFWSIGLGMFFKM